MSFAKKKKIRNSFLTGHLEAASSESISANDAEIFINNTPVQQSFQKWFYLLYYVQPFVLKLLRYVLRNLRAPTNMPAPINTTNLFIQKRWW